MVRHVVLFRWKEGATPEQVDAVAAALGTLPGMIPGIRRFEFGSDLGLLPGRMDFALCADFDDEAEYLAYAEHPAHVEVMRRAIDPIRESTLSVQYLV